MRLNSQNGKQMSQQKKNIKPTESELEILQILWEYGPSTVKFVNDKLNELKDVGYTTTLKLMQIMYEKHLVNREKSGRSHIYKPAVKQSDTQKILLDKILNTAFSGSASSLVMQLLGNKKTSQKELEEIKEMIEKMEKDKR